MALKLHRVAAGLSRDALAHKIGRSASFVATLEKGTHGGPISDLDWFRIAAALGVDRADIEE
jgi:transcriptional regulator with XRE-family HTH domain